MPENKHENEIRVISNQDYFAEVQRILCEGKEVRIRVKGNSMRPFIQDGDTVLLRAYIGSPLPLGSNILAKENDKFVFHRFVGKKNGQYILAGDGNLVLREYVTSTDIIAIAIMHYPKDKGKVIALNGTWARLRGLGWYYMRLIRRIVIKFKSLTQKN